MIRLGLAGGNRRLAESTSDKSELLRLLDAGDQVDILHRAHDSLRSVASGIQRYAPFFDLNQADCRQPATETVLRRGTPYAPGRAFSQYFAHLSIAYHLMNLPPSRSTPAVRGLAMRLPTRRTWLSAFIILPRVIFSFD